MNFIKRHVFLILFLTVQALFAFWIIGGIASQEPCEPGYQDACDVGTGIGVFIIVTFWVMVDVILGVSYGVYKLATRNRSK